MAAASRVSMPGAASCFCDAAMLCEEAGGREPSRERCQQPAVAAPAARKVAGWVQLQWRLLHARAGAAGEHWRVGEHRRSTSRARSAFAKVGSEVVPCSPTWLLGVQSGTQAFSGRANSETRSRPEHELCSVCQMSRCPIGGRQLHPCCLLCCSACCILHMKRCPSRVQGIEKQSASSGHRTTKRRAGGMLVGFE